MGRGINWCLAILMAAMVVVIAAQVGYRFVLNDPLAWSEEAGRYLFVWISFRQVRRSDTLLKAGTAAMRRDVVDLAHKAFLEAVESDPTHYVAFYNLGALMLNERKESRRALKWFQAAARFWDSPVVENNLNQARMALKKGAD